MQLLSIFGFILILSTSAQKVVANPLTDAEQLGKLLDAKSAVVDVLDVRAKDEYQKAHIPSSKWVDIDQWKQQSLSNEGLRKLEFWTSQLRELGLNTDRPVVIVGSSVTNAARAWWLLRYLGVKEVQVLDGGYDAWTTAGSPETDEVTTIEPSKIKLKRERSRLAQLNEVKKQKATVIDSRSGAEYSGERKLGPRGGHIPGAVNLEWTKFIDENNQFLDKATIKNLLKDHGIESDNTVIAHCQTGARSSVVCLALEVAEVESIKNYYRGWSEYSAADAPVEP